MKKLQEIITNKIMNKLSKYRGQEQKIELIIHNYGELNDIVKNFVDTFNKYFEKYNNNLYNNLRTLHIIVDRSPSNDYEGEYKDYKNTLYVSIPVDEEYEVNDQVRETIYHELLHVASSNIYKKYSGFDHELNVTGAKKIGRGINEGFTEYLLLNYFIPNTKTDFYKDEVRIVKEIEKIIGKDKMIEYYFTGNLYDLIKDLSKNYNYSSTIDLIKDIDRLVIKNKEEVIETVKRRGK